MSERFRDNFYQKYLQVIFTNGKEMTTENRFKVMAARAHCTKTLMLHQVNCFTSWKISFTDSSLHIFICLITSSSHKLCVDHL